MSRIEKKIATGFAVTLLLAVFLVLASVTEEKRMAHAEKHRHARSIEQGADLYEIHCRTCHGSRGEGVGQLGPAFNEKKFFADRLKEIGWQDTLHAYIVATTAHGRLMATRPMYAGNTKNAVMPPWAIAYGGLLREDQILDVAAFVLNWEKTALGKVELEILKVPETNLNDPKIVARGKSVFIKHCGDCHAIQGMSSPTRKGPDLNRIGEIAVQRNSEMSAEAYIRESFLIPGAHIVEGFDPKAIGHTCGGVLSMRELDAVTAFLLTRK